MAGVQILWVLYLTSEEDSTFYALLNAAGDGGLSVSVTPRQRFGRCPAIAAHSPTEQSPTRHHGATYGADGMDLSASRGPSGNGISGGGALSHSNGHNVSGAGIGGGGGSGYPTGGAGIGMGLGSGGGGGYMPASQSGGTPVKNSASGNVNGVGLGPVSPVGNGNGNGIQEGAGTRAKAKSVLM